jgi:hypothetical protein
MARPAVSQIDFLTVLSINSSRWINDSEHFNDVKPANFFRRSRPTVSEKVQGCTMLEPIIASHDANMTMQNLTRALDVVTFLNVLALVDKTVTEKFLGDWDWSPTERAAIASAFGAAPPNIQDKVSETGKGLAT